MTTPDPLLQLRPGTPPAILVPDGTGGFIEKQKHIKPTEAVNATAFFEAPTNNGTEINTTNEATKNAFNYNFFGLRSFTAPEAYSSVAFQESANLVRPSSQFPKQTYIQTPNIPKSSSDNVRSMPSNKRVRPNSLPLIPLVDINAPLSHSFSPAASSLTAIPCLPTTSDKHGFSSLENVNVLSKNFIDCKINHSFAKTNNLEFKTEISCDLTKSLNNLKNDNKALSIMLNPKESSESSEEPKKTDWFRAKEISKDQINLPISSHSNNLDKNNAIHLSKLSPLDQFTKIPKPFISPTLECSPQNIFDLKWQSVSFTPSPSIVSKPIEKEVVSTVEGYQNKLDRSLFVNSSVAENVGTYRKLFPPQNIQSQEISKSVFKEHKETGILQKTNKNDDLETKMKSIFDDIENMIVTEAKYDKELKDDYDISSCMGVFDPVVVKSKLNTVQEEIDEGSISSEIKIELDSRNSFTDEELDKYISEIQRSFSATPTFVEDIDIKDLQPPEFYKNTTGPPFETVNKFPFLKVNDNQPTFKNNLNSNGSLLTDQKEQTEHYYTDKISDRKYIWIGTAEKVISDKDTYSSPNIDTLPSLENTFRQNTNNKDIFITSNTKISLSPCISPHLLDMSITPSVQPNQHLILSSPILPNPMLENFAKHSETKTYPWSAEGAAIYKAEVKVVQKPSLPTTPIIDFTSKLNLCVYAI